MGRTALSIGRHDAEPPREEKQAPGVNWDQTFREGKWATSHSIAETPRYAAVAGYVHRLLRKGNLLDAGCGEGLTVVTSISIAYGIRDLICLRRRFTEHASSMAR